MYIFLFYDESNRKHFLRNNFNIFLFNIGVTYRNFNGIDYIGTYCKINKGSVCVTYYESKFSLFMESEHSFIDTYIGTGEDYDEIIDNEPYNREFNVSYIN